MLEEMEIEGRDFEADSWSMAVDSAYLQKHRKDVIKRQDVIYGERSHTHRHTISLSLSLHILSPSDPVLSSTEKERKVLPAM